MSSDYKILCLSHNPAIVIEGDWHSSRDGHIIALAVAANPVGHEATRQHAHCDLLVGRYSYPLVEVACPPSRPGDTKHSGFHREAKWIDASWLRLLAAAYASTDNAVLQAAQRVSGCWSADRVNRLRYELGLETE